MSKTHNSIRFDIGMQYLSYAAMASAMVLVFAECGYALYHLSQLAWPQ